MATDVIRAFVAAEVPVEMRRRIFEAFTDARARFPGLRWVPVDNLHVTVKFLGNVAAGRVDELVRAVRHACESYQPFRIALQGAGVFPPRGAPRVLWVGTARGAGELGALAGEVDHRLAKRGIERESRPFSAHLTLARAGRDGPVPDLRPLVDGLAQVQWGEYELRALALMRSHLGPGGPRYERLAEIGLGAGTGGEDPASDCGAENLWYSEKGKSGSG